MKAPGSDDDKAAPRGWSLLEKAGCALGVLLMVCIILGIAFLVVTRFLFDNKWLGN